MSERNFAVVVAASCNSSIISESRLAGDDDVNDLEEGGSPLGMNITDEGMSVLVMSSWANK